MKTLLLLLPIALTGLFRAVQSEPAAVTETTFVSSLLTPFDAKKNTLWCGTSVIAWKALLESAGERLDRKALAGDAAVLTSDPFGEEHLALGSYVAVGGLDPAEVLKRAKRQLAERFDGYSDPWLEQPGPPVHAYSYMRRTIEFPHAYQDCSDTALMFSHEDSAKDVESFGFRDYRSSMDHRFVHRQLQVLDYENSESFICRLSAKGSDQIVVAQMPAAATLALTWKAVADRIRSKKRSRAVNRVDLMLGTGDHFVVPKVDFMKTHCFENVGLPLTGETLLTSSLQSLLVRLDEKGAELEASNLRSGGGGTPAHKEMICDGPFLLAFLEQGAEWPYCLVWVANADLLVPREEASTSVSDK